MSDAQRQSALLLHGLSQTDREWMLAQLGESTRVQLSAHLQELDQLGLPADPDLLDAVLARPGHSRPSATTTPRQRIESASADTMLHLLGPEPAWLIGTVLGIESWPWREAFMSGLDASRRERIRQALRRDVPVGLATACLERLVAQLPVAEKAARQTCTASVPAHALTQRFKAVVRKWL